MPTHPLHSQKGARQRLIAACDRLRAAERALDRPWTLRASLKLDRALVEFEAARDEAMLRAA